VLDISRRPTCPVRCVSHAQRLVVIDSRVCSYSQGFLAQIHRSVLPVSIYPVRLYLGHIISDALSDDSDVMREVRNLYVRSNILKRRFGYCSKAVKAVLFRSYCVNMYDTALWHSFTARTINRLRSCYHKCLKHFFGYSRRYNVCSMLLELNLPSFDTLLINSSAVFNKNWLASDNVLVGYLNVLRC